MISLFSNVLCSLAESKESLPSIPFGEWNELVRSAASAFQGSEADRHKRFPSTKIQSTFDGIAHISEVLQSGERGKDVDAAGMARLDTTQAEKLSENLRDVPRLGRDHVEQWVGYWKRNGLFG